jgi:sugar (pentulose or hexulose) kinase
MPDVILGLDMGLSFLKLAAFDRHGQLLGHGQAAYQTTYPAPGRAEQDPETWIDLAGGIVRRLVAQGAFRPEDVRAIAPSARGSGAVFVDAEGRVLHPSWLHLDGRNAPQAKFLRERFGPESDNRALASNTLYFKEAHPDLFARLKHPLYLHDFLLFRMTGVAATDPASGPRAVHGQWPEDVWEYIGATPPPVRPMTDLIGELLPATAERLGVPAGIAVANGAHDGACANVGAGAIRVGQVCMTMGTNGVARSVADRPAPQIPWRGISAYHFTDDRWFCGGDASFAGHVATWLGGIVGAGHDVLEPEAGGVVFLPFLRGQIAPERRSEARAAFIGMSELTDRAALYRATMEGVAYLYRSIAARLAELGFGGGEWRVSGGGARNALWMEIMAALLERPLLIVEPEEGPRGAAMCAAVALDWYDSIESCAAEWVRVARVQDPDPALTATYLPLYERYRRLADAVYEADRPIE